jgi:hypothetical protein
MKFTAKVEGTSKFGGTMSCAESSLSMPSRISSLILILFFLSTVAIGMPLHPSDRGCNMAMNEMPGCEHMTPSEPSVQNVQLCCLLDCQGPGSTGAPQVQLSSLNATAVSPLAHRPTYVVKSLLRPSWMKGSSFKPPETYLKNLALLI